VEPGAFKMLANDGMQIIKLTNMSVDDEFNSQRTDALIGTLQTCLPAK